MANLETRPKVCSGPTIKKVTGCGSLYVTVNSYNGGPPIEVIVRLGKAGGCSGVQNQALGRAISIGLQHGIPIEMYINTLAKLECPNKRAFPEKDGCLSCADGISRVMREVVDGNYKA